CRAWRGGHAAAADRRPARLPHPGRDRHAVRADPRLSRILRLRHRDPRRAPRPCKDLLLKLTAPINRSPGESQDPSSCDEVPKKPYARSQKDSAKPIKDRNKTVAKSSLTTQRAANVLRRI